MRYLQSSALIVSLLLAGIDSTSAQSSQNKRAEDALAKCLNDPFNRVACETARQQTASLQFESGAAPNVVYRECSEGKGICLELATLRIRKKLKQEPILASLETLVIFELNSFKIATGDLKYLDAMARAIKYQSNAADKIAVIGHTDALGSEAANCELSRNRASAVRDYLVTRGVQAERLTVLAAGEYLLRFPRAPKARGNRRVAFARITRRSDPIIEKFSRQCTFD